jgi:uncharacterized protein (TIGR02001 family)
MKLKTTLIASLLALSGAAMAQTKAPEPDYTLTGNMTLISDYRFRGFTQTDYGPALQGGFDFAHKSGFYLGNWNSNVLSPLYTGASLEMDFYGGYKGSFGDIGYDVGAIYYYYPKSGKNAPNSKIDNTEVYFGLSYGPVSGKLYYATSDYFDLKKFTPGARSTKGTTYLDLAANFDIGGGVTLGAHVGVLNLKNAGDYSGLGIARLPSSVTDYKLSVTKDFSGFGVSLAYIEASKKGYFTTGQVGVPAEGAGKGKLLLSVAKTF